jgi:hypothetical protein
VAIALVLSTALTFAIAKAYIHTHAGYSYSKTFPPPNKRLTTH